MALFHKLKGLFRSTTPPRVVPSLPVVPLVKAAPYMPAPTPVLHPTPLDAEVMRLQALHNNDPVALVRALSATSRALDEELADLRAELDRLTALPRFKP